MSQHTTLSVAEFGSLSRAGRSLSFRLPLTLVALTCAAAMQVQADTILDVVPNAYASSPAQGFSGALSQPIRSQQLYPAQEFPATAVRITALRWRRYASQTFENTGGQFRFKMSTTSRSENDLSGTFAENVGPNETIVFDGTWTVSSSTVADNAPYPFEMVLNLTTPFIYNPAQGNLLLEHQCFSTSIPLVDAAGDAGDGLARAYNLNSDPNATIASFVDTGGEIIQFEYEVLESSLALVIPAGHESSEGGYYAGTLHEPQLRLQLVYGAANFSAGPKTITELRFRRDIGEPPFSSATAVATVKLSTTTGNPGGLSATFANNPGPDETTVFSGNWTYSSTSPTPGGTVRPFDIVLPLTTPFTYNPSAGNLLFDIRITSNSSFNWTDGVSGGQHQVSRVISLNADALTGDANELTGDVIQLVLSGEQSRILNIDFTANGASVKTGVAAVGDGPGDVWNRYLRDPVQGQYQDPGSLGNLVWADGTASGASLTIANAAGAWDNGSADAMFWSYLYPLSRQGNITVTLTNLPAGEYTFYVYGHGEPDSENGVFTLSNGTATFGPSQTSSAPGWNTTVWAEGVQYVTFQDVMVGGGQPVVLTALPGAAGLSVINGLQLVRNDADVIWFAPGGGVFTNSVQVAIQSSAGVGTIRYTTNGDEPTEASTSYNGPFTLTETTTVKARLFVNGFPASDIAEATYTRYVPPDIQFLPPGGLFTNQVSVALVNNVGAGTIRYTLNGSAPTSGSTVYGGPLNLTAGTTVRAQVYVNTFPVSDVFSESYARVYAFADDGVPFAWREQYFGPNFLTDPCAAAGADCDDDGYVVLEEYQYSTDPTDGDSAPEIILTVRAVPRLTFTTVAGRSYRIQRTETLNPPDWETIVESVLATGAELHYVDEEAPDTSYYQIELIRD